MGVVQLELLAVVPTMVVFIDIIASERLELVEQALGRLLHVMIRQVVAFSRHHVPLQPPVVATTILVTMG